MTFWTSGSEDPQSLGCSPLPGHCLFGTRPRKWRARACSSCMCLMITWNHPPFPTPVRQAGTVGDRCSGLLSLIVYNKTKQKSYFAHILFFFNTYLYLFWPSHSPYFSPFFWATSTWALQNSCCRRMKQQVGIFFHIPIIQEWREMGILSNIYVYLSKELHLTN